MTHHKWPFPGDAPVARARKVALAYRAVAQEQVMVLRAYRELLAGLNLQLVQFQDAELAEKITKAIQRLAEDPVAELDARFLEWGETWHAEVPTRELKDDDEINSKEAGKLLGVAAQTVNRLRMRGRIKGRWIKGQQGDPGRWVYVVKDVYALSTELRGRGWRAKDATVKVPDSGSGDTE